jgi:hypothetical protein
MIKQYGFAKRFKLTTKKLVFWIRTVTFFHYFHYLMSSYFFVILLMSDQMLALTSDLNWFFICWISKSSVSTKKFHLAFTYFESVMSSFILSEYHFWGHSSRYFQESSSLIPSKTAISMHHELCTFQFVLTCKF